MHHLQLQIGQLQLKVVHCPSVMQIYLIAALTAWRPVGYRKKTQSKCPGHHSSQLPLLSTRKLQHANVLHTLYDVVTS